MLSLFFLLFSSTWNPLHISCIYSLTNIRHLALDLDRFFNFASVSLPLIRHASETLSVITVKPSCGWTLPQLLDRLPNLRRIHYLDQFPNSTSLLLHHRTPCPIAFSQITYTSLSKYGFKPLLWLTSHPKLQLDLLELDSCLPDPIYFHVIMENIGTKLRRLHIYHITSACLPPIAHCTALEELAVGGDCWIELFSGISATSVAASTSNPSPLNNDIPTSVSPGRFVVGMSVLPRSIKHVKIFGNDVFPLDEVFTTVFEALPDFPALNRLTFVGDDGCVSPFANELVEREWVGRCQAIGVELSLNHAKVRILVSRSLVLVRIIILRLYVK